MPTAQTCDCGGHAWANITQGYTTIVDPDDAGLLQDRAWYANRRRKPSGTYVSVSGFRDRKTIYLHREILKTDGLVDHVNGDPLDNRRANLRPATPRQNAANRKGSNRSLPKGVSITRGRIRAIIVADGRHRFLGYFKTVEAADAAYRDAAKAMHGAYAFSERP